MRDSSERGSALIEVSLLMVILSISLFPATNQITTKIRSKIIVAAIVAGGGTESDTQVYCIGDEGAYVC